MNNQLMLIDVGTATNLTPDRPQSTLENQTLSNRTKQSSEIWWKLTDKERQQGLAGVRAIRAILQKSDEMKDKNLAKAS